MAGIDKGRGRRRREMIEEVICEWRKGEYK